jgi:hypothetical protein
MAALPMVTQRSDVIQGKRRISLGSSLPERLPKKEKAWRSLSFGTITYVEALVCNRSASGHD